MARAGNRGRFLLGPGKPKKAWSRWIGNQIADMTASGMPVALAFSFANAEAQARDRLARVIGRKRAMRADLLCVEQDGRLTFYSKTMDKGLDDAARDRLESSGAQFIIHT